MQKWIFGELMLHSSPNSSCMNIKRLMEFRSLRSYKPLFDSSDISFAPSKTLGRICTKLVLLTTPNKFSLQHNEWLVIKLTLDTLHFQGIN